MKKFVQPNSRGFLYLALLPIFFAAGFLFNAYFVNSRGGINLVSVHPLRQQNTNYQYINPLLSYDLPPNTEEKEFVDLSQKIKLITAENLAEGKIDRLGVYFKDLNSGQWTGINENGLFQPASLLKVPIMIAYFKMAETDRGILDRYLAIVPTSVTSSTRTPSKLYRVGQQYLTSELIRGMIAESDNNATDTLIANISPGFLSEVFTDLGIKPPNNDPESQAISPKTFGLFFRVLYNGTYLNREFSEKALTLMDQVTFKDGIDDAYLKDIPVADKFGERVISTSNPPKIDLSDCGIVYYRPKPYLLCVMTEGNNEQNLKDTIQNISNVTLDEAKK